MDRMDVLMLLAQEVKYYKQRCIDAEKALLAERKDRHIERLKAQYNASEKEATNKMSLYSANKEKLTQIKQEFAAFTTNCENAIKNAEEIYEFNVKALDEGHPLSELHAVSDDIDTSTLTLPTKIKPNTADGVLNFSALSLGFGRPYQTGDGPSPVPYFPKQEQLRPMQPLYGNMNGPSHPYSISGRPTYPSLTASQQRAFIERSHSDADFQKSSNDPDGQDVLQMIASVNIGQRQTGVLPRFVQPVNESAPPSSQPSVSHSHEHVSLVSASNTGAGRTLGSVVEPRDTHEYGQDANTKSIPDPSNLDITSNVSKAASNELTLPAVKKKSSSINKKSRSAEPDSDIGSLDSFTMGLDPITDSSSSVNDAPPAEVVSQAATQVKDGGWSSIGQILAETRENDSDWQPVKKPRPQPKLASGGGSSSLGSVSTQAYTAGAHAAGASIDNFQFEEMIRSLCEEHDMLRRDVIAVLQVVRTARGGQMNSSLSSLKAEAEKIIASKAVPKGALSLSAKAKDSEHAEPCDNQLCPGRLKKLKYKTEMCLSYQTTGTCRMPTDVCMFAHGPSDLRPLPKEEICERYLEGMCFNKRCVYAHGNAELRNHNPLSTSQYLKQMAQQQQNNIYFPQPREDLRLTDADTDPNGDECSICFESMSLKSRRKLDCGHDSFHYKCLKKWVAQEGIRSCPLCRSSALLPEEFPKLSR